MNHTALFVNRQQIEASVRRAEQALAETVVRIRHEFKDDWTGDPSIFFYIVLTDETTKRPKLIERTDHIRSVLWKEVRPDEQGLNYYSSVRSLSEQNELKDPLWE